MSIKDLIVGGAATLIIGGTSYTVSQTDVVDNFANDTGMSQQEAQKYVEGVKSEDMVDYTELADSYIEAGTDIRNEAKKIDCSMYAYEWESPQLSCNTGKSQLDTIGKREIALGKAYNKLAEEAADRSDINSTIRLHDQMKEAYNLAVVAVMFDSQTVKEIRNINSYNKSLLEAALESE